MEQLQPKRIDRTDLLDNRFFWAIHFNEQTGGEFLVEDFFGLTLTDLEVFWRENLSDSVPGEPDKYPCYRFAFPLVTGYSAIVEYRACPEDFGIDFYIHRPSWSQPLLLGSKEGHFTLPAFRWSEIMRIADAVQTENENVRRAALPLLCSGVWPTEDDDLDLMQTRLSAAWGELGVVKQGRLDDMVARMLEQDCGYDVHWRYEAGMGWVTDSEWSLRNPRAHVPPAYFRQIEEFFAALPGTAESSGR